MVFGISDVMQLGIVNLFDLQLWIINRFIEGVFEGIACLAQEIVTRLSQDCDTIENPNVAIFPFLANLMPANNNALNVPTFEGIIWLNAMTTEEIARPELHTGGSATTIHLLSREIQLLFARFFLSFCSSSIHFVIAQPFSC